MDTYESKIYNIFLISAGLLLLILFYYLYSMVKLQAQHRKDYLNRLGRQVIMLENYRRQLAENLHDELAPMITAAKMHISAVQPFSDAHSINMQQAIALLNELTGRIRQLSANLIPSVIKHKGLARALEEFIFNLNAPGAPLITVNTSDLPHISYHKSVIIYRILQEIIHNTCKHAQASQLHIQLSASQKYLVIATADDGTGFNYSRAINNPTGIGLTGMISRVNLLEGTLSVDDSSRHKGTRYYILIPVADTQTFKFNTNEKEVHTN